MSASLTAAPATASAAASAAAPATASATASATAPVAPLHSGDRLSSKGAYLPSQPGTVLWGRLPAPTDPAVLQIDAGETIVVDTVSHEGMMPDQGSDPLRYFGSHGVAASDVLDDAIAIAHGVTRGTDDGPHIVTGPIHVRGALPGDLLAIRIDALDMRAPYGVISTRHGHGVLNGLNGTGGTYSAFTTVDPRAGGWTGSLPLNPGSPETVTFPLAPFLGIIGVTADQRTRLHSVPPGPFGGNLDIAPLTAGSTLYLPVQVAGAGLYLGDPHYAQGDGEVALTALEAPLRATLTIDLIPASAARAELGAVVGPFAAAHGFVIPTGLSESLDLAMRRCTANAVELVVALFGMDRKLAYLYLSAAADFSVSQAVDVVKGVHGRVRISDFPNAGVTALARQIVEAAR
ncbi:acetamidase/formamidase family protein [Plantibacter sp. Mn2098]|uniref:acetamidase/formamidase family protein n=1 Tax=Plantibacter sp. Mn2098 TaxID=3395266 RepID=UPI003BBB268E